MRDIRAIGIAAHIADAITGTRAPVEVLAVFECYAYLSVGGGGTVLMMTRPEAKFGPLAVVLEDWPDWAAVRGLVGWVEGGVVTLGGLRIVLRSAAVRSSAIPAVVWPEAARQVECVAAVIGDLPHRSGLLADVLASLGTAEAIEPKEKPLAPCGRGGGVRGIQPGRAGKEKVDQAYPPGLRRYTPHPTPSPARGEELEEWRDLIRLRTALALDNPAVLRTAAEPLVGWGSGLTPAGDDFLCGVMTALWMFSGTPTPACTALLAAAQGRTTTLSLAFLHAAARGHVPPPWQAFLSVPPASQTDLPGVLRAILDLGHSSGADTLAGFLWGAGTLAV